jgi:hypothetical protein
VDSCKVFSKEERMVPVTFDALTRRASLLGLGTAGLAALVIPIASHAKKKKKKKGNVNKLCKQQVSECNIFVTGTCESDAECLAEASACCPLLATCDFNGFLACLQAALQPD